MKNVIPAPQTGSLFAVLYRPPLVLQYTEAYLLPYAHILYWCVQNKSAKAIRIEILIKKMLEGCVMYSNHTPTSRTLCGTHAGILPCEFISVFLLWSLCKIMSKFIICNVRVSSQGQNMFIKSAVFVRNASTYPTK